MKFFLQTTVILLLLSPFAILSAQESEQMDSLKERLKQLENMVKELKQTIDDIEKQQIKQEPQKSSVMASTDGGLKLTNK